VTHSLRAFRDSVKPRSAAGQAWSTAQAPADRPSASTARPSRQNNDLSAARKERPSPRIHSGMTSRIGDMAALSALPVCYLLKSNGSSPSAYFAGLRLRTPRLTENNVS